MTRGGTPCEGLSVFSGMGRVAAGMPICAVCVRAAGMRFAQELDGDAQAGGKA